MGGETSGLPSVRPVRNDSAMGSISALAALQLPVRLHGIQLGHPTDLLVQTETWQALGLVVLCGDETVRFLPWAAAQPSDADVAVGSALLLLEDAGFYESRSVSLRALLGRGVERGQHPLGSLRDLWIGPGGAVTELEVEQDGETRRVPAVGSTLAPSDAAAA